MFHLKNMGPELLCPEHLNPEFLSPGLSPAFLGPDALDPEMVTPMNSALRTSGQGAQSSKLLKYEPMSQGDDDGVLIKISFLHQHRVTHNPHFCKARAANTLSLFCSGCSSL